MYNSAAGHCIRYAGPYLPIAKLSYNIRAQIGAEPPQTHPARPADAYTATPPAAIVLAARIRAGLHAAGPWGREAHLYM